MSLLHTWMLWFLPLALLPIVLHLLTLHRLRTVELPTFRFLFDSYIQQRRQLRFLEALLAMLRTLFLLLLVFLLCQPVIQNWDSLFGKSIASSGREVVFLVDCSASMNARTGGTSALERARQTALSLLERLTPADQVTLMRVAARPEDLLGRVSADTPGLREAIENLQPGSSRANLFAALLQVFGPESARQTHPAVYVFTDCQSSSWKEVRTQGLEKLLPAETPFTVVHVGPTQAGENQAVVGDTPRRNRAIAGLPFILTPRIIHQGKAETELTLGVLIDEKEVSRTTLTIKPGETVTRSILYTPTGPGVKRGRFEITSKSPDAFPDDDRFLFTLNVEPRVKVLVVNGNPSEDPFLDEARYLVTALTSQADASGDRDSKKATKEIARSLEVLDLPQASLSAEAIRDASVVVLANCGGVLPEDALRAFVRSGGGLLIFPGDRVNADTYNKQLFAFLNPLGETLTAAKLLPATGDPDRAESYVGLEFDLSHPALTVFDAKESFRTAKVGKRFGLELPKKRDNAWPLAYFEGTRSPALVESKLGEGTVLVAAFPAHPRWGNLPLKPDFVPLLLRLVTYAERRPEAEVQPVVVADGTAELAVSVDWDPAEATVIDPAGKILSLPLERAGARLLGAFEQTGQRGYYQVKVRSARAELLKAAALAFAVNLSPEESDMTFLGEADLRKLVPATTQFAYIDASAQAQELKGPIGQQVEIWGALIWVLFAVIAGEFFLSTLSGRKSEAEQQTLGERVLSVGTGAWVGRMTGAGGGERGS